MKSNRGDSAKLKILIFTSSGGTAHDSAAYALKQWCDQEAQREGRDIEVKIDHVLEKSSPIIRFCVDLYNWIQAYCPWLHQVYWRLIELEDVFKPGTVLVGRSYLIRLLKEFRPGIIVSTHPHTNRGHFDLAKRVLGRQIRCITSCTELDGRFGFTRNWVTRKADLFWALTPEVAAEVRRRGFPAARISILGPLLYPPFHQPHGDPDPPHSFNGQFRDRCNHVSGVRPVLVLGTGANGANNHVRLLEQLVPFGEQIRVIALCGRRIETLAAIQSWSLSQPGLQVEALGFQGPETMTALYGEAWGFVSRPGARTATEALMMGCPLIFNHYGITMPQELLAVRYFRERGLEVSIRKPRDLAAVVAGWLEQPESYSALRQRYRESRLTAEPQRILQHILTV